MPTVVTLGEALLLVSPVPGSRLATSEIARISFVGAESNVSIGLARLGHSVRWLSALGDDAAGVRILRAMRGEGVDVSNVSVTREAQTGLILKVRRPGAEPIVHYYRTQSAFSRLGKSSFSPSSWRDAKILFLTGITPALSDGCRELFLEILHDAKANGLQIWLDPNYRSKLWGVADAREFLLPLLPRVDMLLLGLSEAAMLTAAHEPEEVMRMLRDRGARNVVLKAGAAGAYFFGGNGLLRVKATPVEHVVDPIGAGDAFVAGYMSAWIDGLDPQRCLETGNAVAGIVCQWDGDWEGLPTRAELALIQRGHTESLR